VRAAAAHGRRDQLLAGGGVLGSRDAEQRLQADRFERPR
jgi:hypothetical protein